MRTPVPAAGGESEQLRTVTSGLGSLGARCALIFVWATGLVQTVLLWGERTPAVGVVVALTVTFAGALALSTPGLQRLTVRRSVLVAAVPVVNALATLPSQRSVAEGTWLLDIGAYFAGLLIVRGRPVLGSVGGGIAILLSTAWGVRHSITVEDMADLLAQPLMAVVAGWFFLTLLRRTVTQVTAHRATGTRAVAEARATREAVARGNHQLLEISHSVEPSLRRIARGGQVSRADREEYLLLEAGLRDRLRAPALSGPLVAAAGNDARRRGIDVLLLDDREPLSAALPPDVLRRVAGIIDDMRSGRVTVRVQPTGRGSLVSVVSDDGTDQVRRMIDPETGGAGPLGHVDLRALNKS